MQLSSIATTTTRVRAIRTWRGTFTSRHPLHHGQHSDLPLSSWRPFSSSSSSDKNDNNGNNDDKLDRWRKLFPDGVPDANSIFSNINSKKSTTSTPNPPTPRNEQSQNRPVRWNTIDPEILQHLRRCDTCVDEMDRLREVDTGFHVLFLGTGSGASVNRMPSCTLLRLSQETFIFDAGEGAQINLKNSTAKLKKVTRIFITHMHGDHILGLPGLLLSSSTANLFEQGSTLKVYGPPGLYNFLTTSLVLCHCKLKITVEVYELLGGSSVRQKQQRGALFPQFRHPNIIRKTIPCGEDGVWTIEPFCPITPHTDPRTLDFEIKASELHHVPNVQTVGYVLQERDPQKRIDVLKCEKLGLMPSMKYSELKNGFPVQNDDGTREIQPHEVLIDNEHKGRKVAVLGDTCGIPFPMAQLCKDADVLIHEATLREEYLHLSVRRGHSTASMAGRFADLVDAKVLALNHIGAHQDVDEQDTSRDAKKVIKGDTRVFTASDFMEIIVPRTGFQFSERTKNESSDNSRDDDNERWDELTSNFPKPQAS